MEQAQVRIDEQGYVRDSAGRRLCKVLPGNVLEFRERDSRRYRASGPPRIELMELVKAIAGQALSK